MNSVAKRIYKKCLAPLVENDSWCCTEKTVLLQGEKSTTDKHFFAVSTKFYFALQKVFSSKKQ